MNKIAILAATLLMASTANAQSFRYVYQLTPDGAPSNWQPAETQYGPWVNEGVMYGCSNWSPSPSTIGKGVSFTQTATDCNQSQTRTAQDYELNNIDGQLRPINPEWTDRRVITVSGQRGAIGILENWMAIAPTYTSWVDTNVLYGCSEWTPDPSIYSASTNFTQTSNSCKTDQQRKRQEREQEKFTSEIRNNGAPVTETNTLGGQSASRPYTVVLGNWTSVGQSYACSNWSPAVETIGKGVAFTQTATDCKLDQTRTRAESYKDHRNGSNIPIVRANENRVLNNQAGSRGAIGTMEEWQVTTPTYTAWTNTNAQYGCSVWSPLPSSKTTTATFTQAAADCKTDQTRNRQDREKEKNTGAIRNKGLPVVENQTLSAQAATRSYTVNLGAWANSGTKYACTNWSPAPSTVTTGQNFTQTATDCKQNQTRTRAESYVDHKSGSTVPVSVPAEAQTLSGQTHTQTAIGTKETWIAAAPTYTAWSNTNALYSCTNWTPAPSSKTASATYTQTATDCKTDQTRNRQDREQESTTLAYRNKGAPVVENQTLSAQAATRSYTVTLGAWTNSGAKYACTNWSPAPSTVTINQSFTQTATDCKQDQTRTRAESYVDHKSGATVPVSKPAESQTLTGQTNTQTAKGTKETWIAAAPTYTAWTNTNAQHSCTNWTPAPSSKTATATYTQTASDCKTDQTRNRQDREQESTTLAFRNKGVPVVENQTLASQSASRSYTVTLGAWTNSGAKYGCTNWSPATNTVAVGKSFTQTATDCEQNQTRTRAESYVDHKSGSTVPVTKPAETQTLTGQSNTQTAVGIKETWVAIAPTYTAWTNTNALYGCAAWTPAPSTKTATATFAQTASDCETDQTRNRQDREQETTTLAIRNKGAAVTEKQTLTGQKATRNYTVTLGAWVNSGAKYGCANWSPAPSTVNKGTTFTQTATDCEQNQTRTRAESYVDHKTGAKTTVPVSGESKVLTGQSNTQTATGTKVVEECAYDVWPAPSSEYTILTAGPSNNTGITWKGAFIVNKGAFTDGRPVNSGGYTYKKGKFKETYTTIMGKSDSYEVCRTPL